MAETCIHLDTVHEVTPSAAGCEDCLRTGDRWVHLRICQSCGHIGCCDSSPNRHATAHFHAQPDHPDRPLVRARRGLVVVLRGRAGLRGPGAPTGAVAPLIRLPASDAADGWRTGR